MKNKCIVIGAGTYGQVYAEYLKESYEVIGFLDSDKSLHGKKIQNTEVLGDPDILQTIDKSVRVFVPIGDALSRIRLLRQAQAWGFDTPVFIHKDADVHDSVGIGKCVYILPGTYIMPLVKIKDFVMISLGVNIAHHTIIEEGVFLSQGSNIGASVFIRQNAFCGIAATIMTGVKVVGANALIGAGSVVIRDVDDNTVVAGNPAKVLRKNL